MNVTRRHSLMLASLRSAKILEKKTTEISSGIMMRIIRKESVKWATVLNIAMNLLLHV